MKFYFQLSQVQCTKSHAIFYKKTIIRKDVTNLDLKLSSVTFTQNVFVSECKEPNFVQCLRELQTKYTYQLPI